MAKSKVNNYGVDLLRNSIKKVAAAKKVADDARSEQQKEVDRLQGIQDKLARELASASLDNSNLLFPQLLQGGSFL